MRPPGGRRGLALRSCPASPPAHCKHRHALLGTVTVTHALNFPSVKAGAEMLLAGAAVAAEAHQRRDPVGAGMGVSQHPEPSSGPTWALGSLAEAS